MAYVFKNIKLAPFPGYALIELPVKYESGLISDKDKYATNSSGFLVSINPETPSTRLNELLDGHDSDTIVYFSPYEDGDEIEYNGIQYVFVPIKHIRGIKHA